MAGRWRSSLVVRLVTGVLVVAAVAGCDGRGGPAVGDDVVVADGWSVAVVRDDLAGPTQLALSPDGRTVVVAELAGGEDEGAGRVRELGDDGAADQPITLVEGLLTPTGLAVVSPTALYVQEQRELVALGLEGETPFAPARPPTGAVRDVVVADLPLNGRSQGTVTRTSNGRLLHVSTGTGTGPDPAEGSGTLYALRSGGDGSDAVAVGFKNAYAHAFGPGGELYVTEIGDGTYDGEAPPDELNVIPPAVVRRALRGGEPYDGGWPRCTGEADPTEEFGATAAECERLPRPVALFPPQSTPTSVAVTDEGRVLVALWVDGRVVEVDPGSGEVADVLSGVDRPQHLLPLWDGSILLTVHGPGELWRLAPPGADA